MAIPCRISHLKHFPGYSLAVLSIRPQSKGKHALIICPNGHFGGGRYREDQQQRMGTLARMGAVCVDCDLFGWGESALQVGSADTVVVRRTIIQGNETAY